MLIITPNWGVFTTKIHMCIACQVVCWAILLNNRPLYFASFWAKYATLKVMLLPARALFE